LVKITFDHEIMEDYPTKTNLARKVSRSSPSKTCLNLLRSKKHLELENRLNELKTLGDLKSNCLLLPKGVPYLAFGFEIKENDLAVPTTEEFLLIQFIPVDILVFSPSLFCHPDGIPGINR
jgi:hypothetical protein